MARRRGRRRNLTCLLGATRSNKQTNACLVQQGLGDDDHDNGDDNHDCDGDGDDDDELDLPAWCNRSNKFIRFYSSSQIY